MYVIIDATGCRSVRAFPEADINPTLCLFEFVYFARPDSTLYGKNVHQARVRMGEQLAEQAPVEADMVMGVGSGHATGIRWPHPTVSLSTEFVRGARLGPWLEARFGVFLSPGLPSIREAVVLGGIWLGGILLGLFPAAVAYLRSLQDGVAVDR